MVLFMSVKFREWSSFTSWGLVEFIIVLKSIVVGFTIPYFLRSNAINTITLFRALRSLRV